MYCKPINFFYYMTDVNCFTLQGVFDYLYAYHTGSLFYASPRTITENLKTWFANIGLLDSDFCIEAGLHHLELHLFGWELHLYDDYDTGYNRLVVWSPFNSEFRYGYDD